MAAAFKKPKFNYDDDLASEKSNFDTFFNSPERSIPVKNSNELDLASWNIANACETNSLTRLLDAIYDRPVQPQLNR